MKKEINFYLRKGEYGWLTRWIKGIKRAKGTSKSWTEVMRRY